MKKILIIEDELSYQKLLQDQLVQNGYQVSEATDGKKGLAFAKSEHPDLILLDIKMPIMNGLDMLSELRKDAWGKSAKVIMLTNLEPDKDTLQKLVGDQPIHYLVKSNIKLEELLRNIKDACAK